MISWPGARHSLAPFLSIIHSMSATERRAPGHEHILYFKIAL
jgi:hypothetical protein